MKETRGEERREVQKLKHSISQGFQQGTIEQDPSGKDVYAEPPADVFGNKLLEMLFELKNHPEWVMNVSSLVKSEGFFSIATAIKSDFSFPSRSKGVVESIVERLTRVTLEEEKKKKACPSATRNLDLNLKNRQHAIDDVMYGPANPAKPGKFWDKIADVWDIPESEAKSMRCGNCAAFDISKKMKQCIQDGLTDEAETDSWDTVNAGQLGYCHMLKFKCASKRTCKAWVAGGPVK